jgi:hypothetical protein
MRANKELEEMSDAEFRRFVHDEHGYDPLRLHGPVEFLDMKRQIAIYEKSQRVVPLAVLAALHTIKSEQAAEVDVKIPAAFLDVVAAVIASVVRRDRLQRKDRKTREAVHRVQLKSRTLELYRAGHAKNRKQAAHLIAKEEIERAKAAGKPITTTIEAKAKYIARIIPKPPK